jgi:hypothetical protein
MQLGLRLPTLHVAWPNTGSESSPTSSDRGRFYRAVVLGYHDVSQTLRCNERKDFALPWLFLFLVSCSIPGKDAGVYLEKSAYKYNELASPGVFSTAKTLMQNCHQLLPDHIIQTLQMHSYFSIPKLVLGASYFLAFTADAVPSTLIKRQTTPNLITALESTCTLAESWSR